MNSGTAAAQANDLPKDVREKLAKHLMRRIPEALEVGRERDPAPAEPEFG